MMSYDGLSGRSRTRPARLTNSMVPVSILARRTSTLLATVVVGQASGGRQMMRDKRPACSRSGVFSKCARERTCRRNRTLVAVVSELREASEANTEGLGSISCWLATWRYYRPSFIRIF
jgi:hypothetical protein